MRSLRRTVPAVVLALSALLTLLAVGRTAHSTAYAEPGRAERAVVVGVPALDWDVLTPTTMPHLWQLAEEGGTGLLTTRAARSVTCPWDGWLTFGAGNRARYPATIPEDELPPEPEDPLPGQPAVVPTPTTEPPTLEEQRQEKATAGCLEQRGALPTVAGSKLTPAVTENDKLRFGAVPGALGRQVQCTSVVGDSPVLAVAAEGADVRSFDRPTSAEDWTTLISHCPLTLVAVTHVLDRSPAELQAIDAAIHQIIVAAEADGASIIVAGTAQPEYKRAKLTAIVASGPGFDGQVLSSPSTSRAPYSQLIDLAPTVLSILGEDAPASMTGQILRGEPRGQALADQVAELRTQSVAASAHVWMSGKFFTFMTWLTVLVTVALAWALYRRIRWRPWMRIAGTTVALLPAASLLANVYPWWTTRRPSVAILTAIGIAWVLVSVLCLAGPWRRYRSGPFLAACAVTAGILAVDVLTGSHLQLNSPLGYDAIVAGRFTGFGNITFAMYAAAALVLIAAACRCVHDRRWVTAIIAAAGITLIAVDGAPGAGADFGGVIALAPALLLLWIVVTGTRISRTRLLVIGLSGAAVVAAIAIADYLRPASERTHLGRFVGQIIDGTALTIVQRKLSANLKILTGSVLTILAVVLIAVLVWQWRDHESAGRRYVREHAPQAPAAVLAVLAMAVVGFAVNDSGIAVTAAALMVVLPPAIGMVGILGRGGRVEGADAPDTGLPDPPAVGAGAST